jgi:hypothetical protein
MTDPSSPRHSVQRELLPFERPFVIAHEWSHLAGFADESSQFRGLADVPAALPRINPTAGCSCAPSCRAVRRAIAGRSRPRSRPDRARRPERHRGPLQPSGQSPGVNHRLACLRSVSEGQPGGCGNRELRSKSCDSCSVPLWSRLDAAAAVTG